MGRLVIKAVCFLPFFFITGCAYYKIPVQTHNHPASSNAIVSQLELSPILDIDQNGSIENEEVYVHPQD